MSDFDFVFVYKWGGGDFFYLRERCFLITPGVAQN